MKLSCSSTRHSRELIGNGPCVAQPCPDILTPQHQSVTFPDILCTCCVFRILNRSEAKFQNSSLFADAFRESANIVNRESDLIATIHTRFKDTISPLAFLIFRSLPRKYQNRDFATTSLGANSRMRKSLGVGLASLGRCLPMT